MLSPIAFAALCLGAAWTDSVEVVPPPTPLTIAGNASPSDVVLMAPRSKGVISVAGPVQLRLQLFGLTKRRGRRVQGPGQVTMSVDDGPLELVELSAEPQPSWRIGKHPLWQMTSVREIELSLDEGPHVITLAPSNAVPVGYALRVEATQPATVTTPEASGPAPDVVAGEPGSEGPPAEEPALPSGPLEPPPPPPEVVTPIGNGFVVTGTPPPSITIRGPQGDESFYNVSNDSGLRLRVVGPGVLVLDMHANRSDEHPETRQPIVVGVLLDDVLVQTIALDQPASEQYTSDGLKVSLAKRVSLRLPVKAGSHELLLSLSDNAVDGVSVRPSFEEATNAEPVLLSAETAREGDLTVVPAATSGGISVGLLAGGFLPLNVGGAGGGGVIEGRLWVPSLGPNAVLGLSGGVAYASYAREIADPRTADGRTRLITTLLSAPLVVDLRWHADVSAHLGLEVGAGAGLLLSRTETRARGGSDSTGVQPTFVGSVLLGAGIDVGPGRLLVRASLLSGPPLDAANLRSFNPGGLMLLAGYALGT